MLALPDLSDRLLAAADATELSDLFDTIVDELLSGKADLAPSDADGPPLSWEWSHEAFTAVLGATNGERCFDAELVATEKFQKMGGTRIMIPTRTEGDLEAREALHGPAGLWFCDLLRGRLVEAVVVRAHTQRLKVPAWMSDAMTTYLVVAANLIADFHDDRRQQTTTADNKHKQENWDRLKKSWVDAARQTDGPYFPYGPPED